VPAADIHEQLVEAATQIYGSHAGHRALHAKASWARGTFTARPEASRLSRAAHLSGAPIEALVRFSNASGDPQANDAARDGRGMAVKLRWDGGETDILATTVPTFATRTPEDFLELLRLRRPDPETGQPDMEKLGAWLGDHPEAGPAIQAVLMKEPLRSFATAPYFSPHAFALVDGDGARTWGRWRFEPDDGEHRIADDEARALGRDYLHEELASRLTSGSIGFALRFQLAAGADALDDPTQAWPDEERELLEAGRLEITELVEDPERDGHIDVFDPNRVVAGVELSEDPILRARREAYSVSAYRRWDR
jgi:catalase